VQRRLAAPSRALPRGPEDRPRQLAVGYMRMLAKLSWKSPVARARHYALSRWATLVRYCDDGHLKMDNNAAERGLTHRPPSGETTYWHSEIFRLRPLAYRPVDERPLASSDLHLGSM
jgi:hypothetical protein